MTHADRLECRTGDAERNLQVLHAAISGCCCDLHGSAAALLLVRTGIVQGAEAIGIRGLEDDAAAFRRRHEHLFQKGARDSDANAVGMLDLLATVLMIGKRPDNPALLPRVEVA